MNKSPRLSVLMPVYNREKYVKQSIQSILSQGFTDYKLLILDDGSTDGTAEVIKNIKDDRIVYHYQENKGEYPTTNILLKEALNSDREYITWVHSDDALTPDSLQLRVDALDQHPEAEVAHGDIEKIDSEGKVFAYRPSSDDDNLTVFERYCQPESKRSQDRYYVHHTTMMFRKEILNKTGYFDESLPFAGDIDWEMRVLLNCSLIRVPKILYHYRLHDAQVTEDAKRKGVDTAKVVRDIQARYCKLQ